MIDEYVPAIHVRAQRAHGQQDAVFAEVFERCSVLGVHCLVPSQDETLIAIEALSPFHHFVKERGFVSLPLYYHLSEEVNRTLRQIELKHSI